jgi:hypothetical protein
MKVLLININRFYFTNSNKREKEEEEEKKVNFTLDNFI